MTLPIQKNQVVLKNNIIQNLYETILFEMDKTSSDSYDILLDENYTMEKLNWFSQNYSKNIINEVFSEGEVDIVYYDKPIKTGYQDKFEFTSQNNIKFYTTISYHQTKYIFNQIENNILQLKYYQKDVSCLIEFLEHLKKYQSQYVAYFEFEDFNKVRLLTGQVKNYSYHVLGSVVRSIRQSLQHNQNFLKINSMYFAINKNELKRLAVYDKIISDEMHLMDKKCVDKISNNLNILLYYWSSKI